MNKKNKVLIDTAFESSLRISVRQIKESLEIKKRPAIAIIAGTGWDIAMPTLKNERSMAFDDVMGLSSSGPAIDGHKKIIVAGEYGNKTVIVIRGRIHLNEAPSNPKIYRNIRMLVEVLIKLGIKKIISTSAVGSLYRLNKDGSLEEPFETGSVVVVNGLVTLYAPPLPLWGGEFASPGAALCPKLQKLALRSLKKVGKDQLTGGHVMLLGPWFETTEYDKAILTNTFASVVGMSLLPEAAIVGLYEKVKVLGLCLVTNSPTEFHSHKVNLARAHKNAPSIKLFLKNLFSSI